MFFFLSLSLSAGSSRLNEKLIFALVAGNEGGSRNVLHPGATELESFWCSFSCSHN